MEPSTKKVKKEEEEDFTDQEWIPGCNEDFPRLLKKEEESWGSVQPDELTVLKLNIKEEVTEESVINQSSCPGDSEDTSISYHCNAASKKYSAVQKFNEDSDSDNDFFGCGEDDLEVEDREDLRDVAEEQKQRERDVLLHEEWRQVGVTEQAGLAREREREWRDRMPTFNGARCGAQRVWSSKDPYDFFRAFFSQAIIEKIVLETNRYAESILASRTLALHSRFHEWKATTPQEMEKFLGVQVAMGLCAKPSIPNYWAMDTQQLNWTPNYSRVMSRKRYELLNSCLHFNNNSLRRARGDEHYDPLFKIRPLIDAVLLKFREEYYPHQDLSVEESAITFSGRVFFRQHIPSKRVRFRTKSFVLTDSRNNYTYLWDVYTGGASNNNLETGIGFSAVTQLTKDASLLGKGHILYTDDFYTSPALYISLYEQGTGACGTVRRDRRGMPPQLCDINLRTADPPVFYEKKPLLAAAFKDAGTVTVLSTVHDTSVITKRVRTKGISGYKEVVKPRCVEDYNHFMGGVDRADQPCSYYSFTHRSMKWYVQLYHHVREVALVNAHILFKEATGIAMPTPDFRNQVVAGLIGRALEDAPPLPPSELPGVPARLSGRHFLDQREGRKPDCKVCSNRKRGPPPPSNRVVPSTKKTGRRQTPFFCKTCPEKPALCPVPCFETYHTKVVYK